MNKYRLVWKGASGRKETEYHPNELALLWSVQTLLSLECAVSVIISRRPPFPGIEEEEEE